MNGYQHSRYPLDALPVPLGGAVHDVYAMDMVPIEVAAAALLTAASCASQRTAKVRLPLSGAIRPCSVSFFGSLASGGGKTAALGRAMASIEEIAESLSTEYEENMRCYRAKHQLWSKRLRKQLQMGACEEDAGTELQNLYEQEPIKPRRAPLISTNATERALLDAVEGTGQSICMVVDEGEVLLKDRFIESIGSLNSAWSGGPLRLAQANGKQMQAHDIRLAMTFFVQPHIFEDPRWKKRLHAFRGSGFLGRFLVFSAHSLQGFRFRNDQPPSTNHLESFHRRIRQLMQQSLSSSSPQGVNDKVYDFDPVAARRYIEIGNEIESLTQQNQWLHDFADFSAKALENIARLAALFHHFKGGGDYIGIESVQSAHHVVLFHLYEAVRMFHSATQEQRDAQVLSKYMHKMFMSFGKTCFAKNEVLRNGPLRSSVRLEAALAVLSYSRQVALSTDLRGKHYISIFLPSMGAHLGQTMNVQQTPMLSV